MYRTGNSMNNLLSYCGLIDAKIRASDKDLPVTGKQEPPFALILPIAFAPEVVLLHTGN